MVEPVEQRIIERNRGNGLAHGVLNRLNRHAFGHIVAHSEQLCFARNQLLRAHRQQIVEEDFPRVRVFGFRRHKGGARRDQGEILGHDDAEVRVFRLARQGVGAKDTIGNGMLARGDFFHHRARRCIGLQRDLPERFIQIPRLLPEKLILIEEVETNARAFGIIGGNLILQARAFGLQQRQQRFVRGRHIGFRQHALVVNDRYRLGGGAIDHIAVNRPIRQMLGFRRLIGQCITARGQLYLQIGRRRPGDIGGALARGDFGDETIIKLGRVQIAVIDLDSRKSRFEILHQAAGEGRIGGRIDRNLAFFHGGFDGFAVIGRIARRNFGSIGDAREEQQAHRA